MVGDSAVLPHPVHDIHPISGLDSGTPSTSLTLAPRGRQGNRKMENPMLSRYARCEAPTRSCTLSTTAANGHSQRNKETGEPDDATSILSGSAGAVIRSPETWSDPRGWEPKDLQNP